MFRCRSLALPLLAVAAACAATLPEQQRFQAPTCATGATPRVVTTTVIEIGTTSRRSIYEQLGAPYYREPVPAAREERWRYYLAMNFRFEPEAHRWVLAILDCRPLRERAADEVVYGDGLPSLEITFDRSDRVSAVSVVRGG